VRQLSKRPDGTEFYVQLLFPGGKVVATGFRLQADAREIDVLLQRQLPSGLGNGALQLSLPRFGEGVYRKAVSGTEVFLCVAYWPYGMKYAEIVELRIATNPELLVLVTNEARIQ
jgi:hypothetical protein